MSTLIEMEIPPQYYLRPSDVIDNIRTELFGWGRAVSFHPPRVYEFGTDHFGIGDSAKVVMAKYSHYVTRQIQVAYKSLATCKDVSLIVARLRRTAFHLES